MSSNRRNDDRVLDDGGERIRAARRGQLPTGLFRD
jgi:hypothetical protein